MGERKLMQISEAIAEAAIQADCRFFAGYPITPMTEILEYMSHRMPEVGGVCMNAGGEMEAIAMMYGAACCGVRSMFASSSTGFSLIQEYSTCFAERSVPALMVNVCRSGLQADYYQLTRGGGHGDYRQIVLAPATGQEAVDHTILGFHLADKWRIGAVLFADTAIAHASETVEFNTLDAAELPAKDWITDGAKGRERHVHGYPAGVVEGGYGMSDGKTHHGAANLMYGPEKLAAIAREEARHEEYRLDDAEFMIVAFGTAARTVRPVIDAMRAEGVRVGLFRPITVWPFSYEALGQAAKGKRQVLVYELNWGQMVDDVRIAIRSDLPITSVAHHGTHAIGFGKLDTPEIVRAMLERNMLKEEALAR